MKVRQAELRDIPAVAMMFHELLNLLKSHGQWVLSDNAADVENGVIGFLLFKMSTDENILLVTVDDKDWPNGFLAGWIMNYPPFYQHKRVGEIQFMYPASFDRSPYLLKEFTKWRQGLGATAESNYATPGHKASIKFMERDGRKITYYHFLKPDEVTTNET